MVKQADKTSVEEVVVCNDNGLHIRPASMIALCAARYQSKITLEANGKCVDASSIFDILLLAASKGTRIRITAIGPDHCEAVAELAGIFREGFPFEPVPEKLT